MPLPAWQFCLFTRIHQALEEEGIAVFDVPNPFRMPLDRPTKFLSRVPDGFDDAILAAAHDSKTGCHIFDGLVMMAVDTDDILPGQRMQRSAGFDDAAVAGSVMRGRHAVGYIARGLCGNILIQSATI